MGPNEGKWIQALASLNHATKFTMVSDVKIMQFDPPKQAFFSFPRIFAHPEKDRSLELCYLWSLLSDVKMHPETPITACFWEIIASSQVKGTPAKRGLSSENGDAGGSGKGCLSGSGNRSRKQGFFSFPRALDQSSIINT